MAVPVSVCEGGLDQIISFHMIAYFTNWQVQYVNPISMCKQILISQAGLARIYLKQWEFFRVQNNGCACLCM